MTEPLFNDKAALLIDYSTSVFFRLFTGQYTNCRMRLPDEGICFVEIASPTLLTYLDCGLYDPLPRGVHVAAHVIF